jgi:hypothetical protein
LEKEFSLLKEKTDHGNSLDWLRLLGGEPLLHENLITCTELTRELFPNTKIGLVTNALLLPRMKEMFFDICLANNIEILITDYKIIDVETLSSKIRDRGVQCTIYRNGENWYYKNIRLTSEYKDCFKNCYHKRICNNYRKGKIYLCPQMAYIHIFNDFFQQNIPVSSSDYVDLNNISNFCELKKTLLNVVPQFCNKYCNNITEDGATMYQSTRRPSKKIIEEFCEI